MEYKIYDKVIMKKNHPCKKSDSWTIIRMGADIKIKCDGCGAIVMMSRREFESKLKSVIVDENDTYKDYKIGNILKLKGSVNHDCKKIGWMYQSDNKWKIVKLGDFIELECVECGKRKTLPKEWFFKQAIKSKKPKKGLTQEERNLIKLDVDFQIKKFGKKLELNDWILLRKCCLECSSRTFRIIKFPKRVSAKVEIKCLQCGTNIEIDRKELYELIESIDYDVVLNNINPTYEIIDSDEKAKIDTSLYYNISSLYDNNDVLLNLQLIDSSNNHVTKRHSIKNKIIKITFRKDSKYGLLLYKCHYCSDCDQYFDFYNSFKEQLDKFGINQKDVCCRLISSIGNYDFEEISALRFDGYNKESLLHSFGYKVGYSGLNEKERHKIIDQLLKKGVMSISEMKATINHDLNLFSSREEYKLALKEWNDDLDYLNCLIKKNAN